MWEVILTVLVLGVSFGGFAVFVYYSCLLVRVLSKIDEAQRELDFFNDENIK